MTTEPRRLNAHRKDGERMTLDGIVFTIEEPVVRFLASTFPEKRVAGDFEEESHPLVSSITWKDLRGGNPGSPNHHR